MKRRINHKRAGFTLVEILVTIAVIAILLGFLIPALTTIEKSALKVRQRAQFHGIEVALEAFATDMGDYPPSAFNAATYGDYSASQRLAEAMVGRDGFGFHSDSIFYETGVDNGGNPLYYPDIASLSQAEIDANLAKRKGPYLELESANAVRLSDIYRASLVGLVDSYVLADMYKLTKNRATGNMIGSPILYYRANRNKTEHALPAGVVNNCTYNVYDSVGQEGTKDSIVDLPPLSGAAQHPMLTSTGPTDPGMGLFYTRTQNPNFTNPPRPYRADSFILQSAGPDGLYGTLDDVFNFDQEQ